MKISSTYPIVALVGRENVGKSTLFNRLAEDVKSITSPIPGVTRDVIHDTVSWQGKFFELVDTGGIKKSSATADEMYEQVQERALAMANEADVVLFVCDGKEGILPEDRRIAAVLRKRAKPVIVVVNKIDNDQELTDAYETFASLRGDDICFISAHHGKGIDLLFDALLAVLPQHEGKREEEKITCSVALIGKPNVGKSSLMNALLKQERAIVSAVAGTTREPLKETITFYQEDMQLIDTPGIRKKRSVEEGLEKMMVKTSMYTIKKADIVLLLVDICEGRMADQELKLAFYIFSQQHKALIVLCNKSDIAQDASQKNMEESFDKYDFLFDKLEHMTISCKTGKNIGRIVPLIDRVWKRYNQELPEQELFSVIKEALIRTPLYKNQKQLRVHGVQQIKKAPITLVLTVTEPHLCEQSHHNFFDRVVRKHFNLKSVPLVFIFRKK
ncbi:MAG TPA: ribosome biogenesis GTPase Der [Candidatus Bathyarchaeia archaeon]|nr:ribosome biogenesis GTPase Der [Candidatus Bathyarchaeia archaeon]